MAVPVFDIAPSSLQQTDMLQSSVLIEIGERHVSFLWYKKNTKQLLQWQHFQYQGSASWPPFEWVQDTLVTETGNRDNVKEAIVVYNLPDCLLVPLSSYTLDANRPMVETLCGNVSKGLVLSEKIRGKDIYAIYRVPSDLHRLIQKTFTSGKYWHFYSLLLQAGISSEAGGPHIQAIFLQDKVVAAFYGEKGILLLQTYTYQQPEDVSWVLLHACQQLGLDSGSIAVELSGLIEKDSTLYKELEKYFGRIQWTEVSQDDWGNEPLNTHPPHYFSTLLKMALCV